MHLRRLAVTFVAALVVAVLAPKVFAQVRIAVVDLQRAMNETEDGRQARQRLKTLFKRRQDALDGRQNDLKKMKDDLDKQRDVLSKEVLSKRFEEYQKQFVDLQGVYVEYQR